MDDAMDDAMDDDKPPMTNPASAPWNLIISDRDFEKMKAGFEAEDMDQKWEVLVTDLGENGRISVHLTRSWAQEDFYVLFVRPNIGGSGSEGSGVLIESITWENGDWGTSEEKAKMEAVDLARGLLEVDLDAFPFFDPKELRDY